MQKWQKERKPRAERRPRPLEDYSNMVLWAEMLSDADRDRRDHRDAELLTLRLERLRVNGTFDLDWDSWDGLRENQLARGIGDTF